MTMREKLLVIWVFAAVIAGLVVAHAAGHAAFVVQDFFAVVLPVLRP